MGGLSYSDCEAYHGEALLNDLNISVPSLNQIVIIHNKDMNVPLETGLEMMGIGEEAPCAVKKRPSTPEYGLSALGSHTHPALFTLLPNFLLIFKDIFLLNQNMFKPLV